MINNIRNMPIVSISLNEEILSELDKLQISMGFSDRSEAIRAGIRTVVSEEKKGRFIRKYSCDSFGCA